MKKLTLIAFVIAIALFSCKKDDCKPQIIENTKYITITDSTGKTDTLYIHDTINFNASKVLPGSWYCYNMEDYQGGVLISSTPHNDWIFTFTSTTFDQKLGTSNYSYPITYYVGGTIDIFYTSTPTTYFVTSTANGQEFQIVKSPGRGTYQIWYLKK